MGRNTGVTKSVCKFADYHLNKKWAGSRHQPKL
jgi:hypothetical protein